MQACNHSLFLFPFPKDELTSAEAPYELEEVEAVLHGTITIRHGRELTLDDFLRILAYSNSMTVATLLDVRNFDSLAHAAVREYINKFVTACGRELIGEAPAYRALRDHVREWIPFIEIHFVYEDK